MIEVDGLIKSYRKGGVVTEVLKGVSFTIARGEFVAIMGPSGSGKSTLMNILGFLDRPDAGHYRFDGETLADADDDTLSAVRNRRVGFIFQQFYLLDRASARENVMLPLLYAEDDVADDEARADRALAAVGLADRRDHRPGELSGGQQQRVAIARALINDPALILADEPTGNLDAASGGEVLALFEGLRSTDRTIVLITHDPAVAERADRVLVLEDGRIREDRPAGRPRAPAGPPAS